MSALLHAMLAKFQALAEESRGDGGNFGDAEAYNRYLQQQADTADKERANLQIKKFEDENDALDNFEC